MRRRQDERAMEAQIHYINNNTPYTVNADYNYGRGQNNQIMGNPQWMPEQQQVNTYPNLHIISGVVQPPQPPPYNVAVHFPPRKATSVSFA